MKLLWLCNMMPGILIEQVTGKKGSGLWVDHVLSGLRTKDFQLHILFPGSESRGEVDAKLSFASFPVGAPQIYRPALADRFCEELEVFQPDLIHIWGTEYGHTLAMVNAAEKAGMLPKVVISIQGLCSYISRHYREGVPESICRSYTFRDLLKRENILRQQKIFALRGDLEIRALKKVSHIIGRTAWDRACTYAINPRARYHFCNETLREEFFEGKWSREDRVPHRIFASSCSYPVKGFHYLLEAAGQLKHAYPDLKIAVTGRSFLDLSGKELLRRSGYQKYLADLARKYGLERNIEFTGKLGPEEMKREYLRSSVFVLPSTVENSPNSLGEAMLLGVPCVAADVGGVSSMLVHGDEGCIYQSAAPYMLAHYIRKTWEEEEKAEKMGAAARVHAQNTHDPHKNLEDLIKIYETIVQCEG